MMKKIILISTVLLIVVSACKETKTTVVDTPEWEFDKISLKKELIVDNDSTKGGMKLNLEFNYPSKYGNDSLLKQIQSVFVYAFAGDTAKGLSPKDAFDVFEKSVERDGMEMGRFAMNDGPDFSNYYRNVITTVEDTTDILITAKTYADSYTGGAHGAHQTFYYNIDLRTGKLITEGDLYKGDYKEVLISLIKAELDERNKDEDRRITILEPEAVVPNGNFYLDDKGVVYVYNEYDIAPYSDGLIEVTIPYEKIEALITPQYQELIKK